MQGNLLTIHLNITKTFELGVKPYWAQYHVIIKNKHSKDKLEIKSVKYEASQFITNTSTVNSYYYKKAKSFHVSGRKRSVFVQSDI